MESPLASPNLLIFDYVLPLFIGPEARTPTVVEGTAFPIGGGCFITAAHCMREAEKAAWVALGTTDGKQIRAWDIDRAWDVVDDFDIAVFRAAVPAPVKCFAWHPGELPMASTVKAAGYPYAMDLERQRMVVRSFVGHIVSATTFGRLKPDPPSYELSFQCPRGLSGAPLLIRHGDSMLVTGFVIGNERTEMNVFTEKESLTEGNETTTVERYEALNLGVALQGRAVLDLKFKLLNEQTLRDHLRRNGLLLDT